MSLSFYGSNAARVPEDPVSASRSSAGVGRGMDRIGVRGSRGISGVGDRLEEAEGPRVVRCHLDLATVGRMCRCVVQGLVRWIRDLVHLFLGAIRGTPEEGNRSSGAWQRRGSLFDVPRREDVVPRANEQGNLPMEGESVRETLEGESPIVGDDRRGFATDFLHGLGDFAEGGMEGSSRMESPLPTADSFQEARVHPTDDGEENSDRPLETVQGSPEMLRERPPVVEDPSPHSSRVALGAVDPVVSERQETIITAAAPSLRPALSLTQYICRRDGAIGEIKDVRFQIAQHYLSRRFFNPPQDVARFLTGICQARGDLSLEARRRGWELELFNFVAYEPVYIFDEMRTVTGYNDALNRAVDAERERLAFRYANLRHSLQAVRVEMAQHLLDTGRYPDREETFTVDSEAARLLHQVIQCNGVLSDELRVAIRDSRFQCLLSAARVYEV